MPKQPLRKKPESSESPEESSDSYESASSMGDAPEVDRRHLMNYESDDDSIGSSDDDGLDLAKGL